MESVDSICRASVTCMQYIMIPECKKSLNVRNGKLISLYNNLPFICVFVTNNTPIGAIKHHKSTEPESCQMAKKFFFLLLQMG